MFRNIKKSTTSNVPATRGMQPERSQTESVEESQTSKELPKFQPKSIGKDSMYVTFSGVIEYGLTDDDQQLSVMYTIWAGEDWKLVNGQKTGFSQVGSCYSSATKKIVWNMPFEVTFQTTVLTGWPQLVLQLYGRDFFGRNIIKSYGCVHLPCSEGKQERTVMLFLPKPISIITGILGYLNGCTAELKEAERVLATGDGRQVTRVRTTGSVHIKVETVKYNFSLYGYS